MLRKNPHKIVLGFVALALFSSYASSQKSYSESAPYKPKKEAKLKDQDKTPISGNETVTIPISVRDKTGKYVTDLVETDVKVLVDNVEVPLVSLQKENEPLNVVLVLDTSPSLNVQPTTLRTNAIQLVRQLPPDANVTVIEISSTALVRCQAMTSRVVLEKCISTAEIGKGKAIYDAIETFYQELLPTIPGKRKSIVLLTDGIDYASRKDARARSVAEVEKTGVPVVAVHYDTYEAAPAKSPVLAGIYEVMGPTRDPFPGETQRGEGYLNDLARASAGRIFSRKNFDRGSKTLVDELQTRYYATIYVAKKGPGSRQVRVRINRPDLEVVARGSFVEK